MTLFSSQKSIFSCRFFLPILRLLKLDYYSYKFESLVLYGFCDNAEYVLKKLLLTFTKYDI